MADDQVDAPFKKILQCCQAPVAGAGITFSVTFDQAFVDANPVSGGVYDYFCIVHIGFGMTGTVTINQGVPYGCGVNPPGSLTTLSGKPQIGTTWTLGIDNPLGTQPSGLAFLRISLASARGANPASHAAGAAAQRQAAGAAAAGTAAVG